MDQLSPSLWQHFPPPEYLMTTAEGFAHTEQFQACAEHRCDCCGRAREIDLRNGIYLMSKPSFGIIDLGSALHRFVVDVEQDEALAVASRPLQLSAKDLA